MISENINIDNNNANSNGNNNGNNGEANSSNEIKVEFISSDKSSSDATPTADSFFQKVEDINDMKLRDISQREQKIAEGEIELNTDLDFQLLKNKVAPSSNANEGSKEAKNQNDFIGNPETYYKSRRVLIDAGPTYELIDDVRFIGNFSTGKMGFALAEAAASYGAEVVLISGPVNLECSKNIYRINVTSAAEMHDEVMKYLSEASVIILAAAVADFTPKYKYDGKIKKDPNIDTMTIELVKTKDILAEVGKIKKAEQKLVGFALEADNLIENATIKLRNKNCDMIVANRANQKDSGFGGDNNTIKIIKKDNSSSEYPPMSKKNAAIAILNEVIKI